MNRQPIRQRWRDLPRTTTVDSDGNPLEREAGDLFRAAPPPRPREPLAVSNLFVELRGRRRPWGEALRRVFAVRRLAVAFSLFLSLNLALAISLPNVEEHVSKKVGQWWSRVAQAAAGPRRRAKPSVAPPAPSVAVVPVPAIAIEPPPVEPPIGALGVAEIAAPSRPRRRSPAPIASPEVAAEPAAPVPSVADPEPRDASLAGESQLLSKALTALSEGQPSRALAALATYREKFPHGSMAYEAALAEVKAEMASDQVTRALAALDRALAVPGFEGLPRSDELTLMRAELLARSRRCAEALPTFDRLAGPASPGESSDSDLSFVERALYGRASCQASEGDAAASRASLQDYLRRFPNGRFAAAARAALAAP